MRERPPAVVWLDRDGTIVDDPGYLADPDALTLLPGAAEAVAALHAAGVLLALVTNQSGIARGLMTATTVEAIHAELLRRLRAQGGDLDGIFVCPHLPAELVPADATPCRCRKPRPGLVERARAELGLEGATEIVVGDKLSDLQLAHAVSAAAVLVRTGCGEETRRQLTSGDPADPPAAADFVAADLGAAVPWILRRLGLASGGGNC